MSAARNGESDGAGGEGRVFESSLLSFLALWPRGSHLTGVARSRKWWRLAYEQPPTGQEWGEANCEK